VKPAEFYFFTTPAARARQSEDARLILDNTTYLLEQMRTHFPQSCPVRANPLSNTVYFRDPGDAIVQKYSLATMHLSVDDRLADYAHVVVMPHVSRGVIDQFLTDLDAGPRAPSAA
jgi:histidine decarboxylase